MDFERLAGYGWYVWGAYGLFAIAIAGELIGLAMAKRRLHQQLAQARLIDELATEDARRRAATGQTR